MAPEHFKNGALTEEADVWSFGCLLTEFVTRRLPFCKIRDDRQVRRMLEDDKMSYEFNYASEPPSYIKFLISACTRRDPKTRLSFKEIDNYLNTVHVSSYDSREIVQVPGDYSLLPTPEVTFDEDYGSSTTMKLYPSLTNIETKLRLLTSSQKQDESAISPIYKFEFKLPSDKTKDVNNNTVIPKENSSKLIILNGDSDEEETPKSKPRTSQAKPSSDFANRFILFGNNKHINSNINEEEAPKSKPKTPEVVKPSSDFDNRFILFGNNRDLLNNIYETDLCESSSDESENEDQIYPNLFQKPSESVPQDLLRSFGMDFTPEASLDRNFSSIQTPTSPVNFAAFKTNDSNFKDLSNLSKISEASEPSSWENGIYTPESNEVSFIDRTFDTLDNSQIAFGTFKRQSFNTNAFIADKRTEIFKADVKKDSKSFVPIRRKSELIPSSPSSSSADEQSPKSTRKPSTNDSGIQYDFPASPVVVNLKSDNFDVEGAKAPLSTQVLVNYLNAPMIDKLGGTKTTFIYSSRGSANGNLIYRGPRNGYYYFNKSDKRQYVDLKLDCVDIAPIIAKWVKFNSY